MNNEHNTRQSAYVLVVVNVHGFLRELYCPFRVRCIKAPHTIPAGTWVYVDKLATTTKDLLMYQVNGSWYAYECFAIIIQF